MLKNFIRVLAIKNVILLNVFAKKSPLLFVILLFEVDTRVNDRCWAVTNKDFPLSPQDAVIQIKQERSLVCKHMSKHNVGFSEAVEAISQELMNLICRVVLFKLFYRALCYLEYSALHRRVSVCDSLRMDKCKKFSVEETLFPEA